jgi:hypothetical protein
VSPERHGRLLRIAEVAAISAGNGAARNICRDVHCIDNRIPPSVGPMMEPMRPMPDAHLRPPTLNFSLVAVHRLMILALALLQLTYSTSDTARPRWARLRERTNERTLFSNALHFSFTLVKKKSRKRLQRKFVGR